jgi:hypothetical protein
MTVKIRIDDSIKWLTSGSVIIIVLSSTNRTNVETELILVARI